MKETGYILGISAYYHDSAACLLRDGEIVAAAQEERFTRKKNDFSFPAHAVDYCLRQGGIRADDLEVVAFYDKPFIKFERILKSYLAQAPAGLRSFLKAIPLWMKQKLWIRDDIARHVGFDGKIIFPEHHQSHAASAFYPSPYREAAFLTIDGVGEWATTSFGTGRDNRLDIRAEIHFPHSLGLLYSAFTYYTGFKVNSGEYKLMGLAPYGEPEYRDLILEKLVDLKEDGSFRLNMEYFDYCTGLTMTGPRFHRLFGGPPRDPESVIDQRIMNLARSIQEVTEIMILKMVEHVHRQTGCRYLCLAGGVALNCVANGRILRESAFEDIWIQPAAGDAGGALGAALFAWHGWLGRDRVVEPGGDRQQGSYLGPEFSDNEIREFLRRQGCRFVELSEDRLLETVADQINAGRVIGWFQGRMEYGPRALGNRSIIGDARSTTMQETINLKIKFRESFRPFAPSVLRERAGDYFDLDRESPYMLLVAPVREELRHRPTEEEQRLSGLARLKVPRSTIPAVTHVDCSARVQTVSEKDNPLYHRLLRTFDERHGCGVIVNTSFNVRGEPIVCTPEDAYRCFMRTGMDTLVLGRFLLEKEPPPHAGEREEG
ncbi:carbamoyltransferase [Thermodesulfobacteriota bacterium B35]